jgi:hypothetical protein
VRPMRWRRASAAAADRPRPQLHLGNATGHVGGVPVLGLLYHRMSELLVIQVLAAIIRQSISQHEVAAHDHARLLAAALQAALPRPLSAEETLNALAVYTASIQSALGAMTAQPCISAALCHQVVDALPNQLRSATELRRATARLLEHRRRAKPVSCRRWSSRPRQTPRKTPRQT